MPLVDEWLDAFYRGHEERRKVNVMTPEFELSARDASQIEQIVN